MSTGRMTTGQLRRDAHELARQLIDRLPKEHLPGIVWFLECIAPDLPDCESDCEQDIAAEQLVADLGFTMEQVLRVRN